MWGSAVYVDLKVYKFWYLIFTHKINSRYLDSSPFLFSLILVFILHVLRTLLLETHTYIHILRILFSESISLHVLRTLCLKTLIYVSGNLVSWDTDLYVLRTLFWEHQSTCSKNLVLGTSVCMFWEPCFGSISKHVLGTLFWEYWSTCSENLVLGHKSTCSRNLV